MENRDTKILLLTLCFIVNNVIAQTVFITKTGGKYHKEVCRFLRHSKKEISLEKANKYRYKACKVCKPYFGSSTFSANKLGYQKGVTSKKSYSVQCLGRTKYGRRCRRKTKSSSGRCYQH